MFQCLKRCCLFRKPRRKFVRKHRDRPFIAYGKIDMSRQEEISSIPHIGLTLDATLWLEQSATDVQYGKTV